MDLSTMMNKINMHKYTKAREFLDDIDLITSNALEYNPDRHPEGKKDFQMLSGSNHKLDTYRPPTGNTYTCN